MNGNQPAGDPFLDDVRDEGEERADRIVREFLLRADPPAQTCRQCGHDGYALMLPSRLGERVLTIPGAREADFTFHGNPGTSAGELAAFVAKSVHDARADLLRLPLLTSAQAASLQERLQDALPGWRLSSALHAVAPFAEKPSAGAAVPQSFRRAIHRAEQAGLSLDTSDVFPAGEIRALHGRRWGDNRSESFFDLLAHLVRHGSAELLTLRDRDGSLVATHLDILGARTRHYYHSSSDTERSTGSGTAALAGSWTRFAASDAERVYSFGRGSERYKYRHATGVTELFELRGFYAP